MRELVKKLALNVEAPLVIDSTEADVLKDALEQYPGRAIVNSINMENGRARIEAVMPLRRGPRRGRDRADHRRGGHGQDAPSASSRSRARSTTSSPSEYGLAPEDLIFDAADLPPRHRRRGVHRLGDRDASRASA